MTIAEIMKEVMYGKDYCTFETTKESLEKSYDKDSDIFYASKRVSDISNKVVFSEEDNRIVNRIVNKLESVESRIYNEEKMSDSYKKLMTESLYEDCEKFNSEVNKRASYAAMKGKKEIGEIVATVKYFAESYLDDSAVLRESSNLEFNRFIKDEGETIKQVL